MRRKSKPEIVRAELLPLGRTLSETDFKRMVAQAIEQKVAEAMSEGSHADFQPFFQSHEVSYEIKRRQTVTEQQKWSFYYSDWGCMICGAKDKPHDSNGMCQTCKARIRDRIKSSLRKRAPAPSGTDLSFMDTVRMAREALAPELRTLPPKTARRKRETR